MGNALRFLYKNCCQPTTTDSHSHSLGPHGVSIQNVGVSALAQDILHFEVTSQVPEGLSKHVVSSKKAQANWYRKLLEAWKEAKPPPKTPEETTRLIIQTLKRHQKADVEGLLAFYGLPLPHTLVQFTNGVPSTLPDGVKYELHTLPVDAKAVADGDTITVYVSTADPRESSSVPKEVQVAAIQRSKARAERNYDKADALHKKIIDQNYRVINIQNEEVLAKKYRIRLRGIDAPESAMPYGKQAKEELTNLVQGKSVWILVYEEDRYGRYVGDVYCNGIFAQGGIVLGPSVLGQVPGVANVIFPQRGHVIIETLATFGIVLFLFSIGVKMDTSLMFKPHKVALTISISLFVFTLIIPLVVTVTLISQIDMNTELKQALPVLIGTQSLVAFPAIACVLAELKIFNTEVGRIAVSTSMFYDLLALGTCAFGFAYFETREAGAVKSFSAIMSILGFIFGVIVVARFFLLRFLVPDKSNTKNENSVSEVHLSIVFVALFVSTLLSEIVGQHYFLGPIILGLALPDSSPLGSAVVTKLDTMVSGVLYPTFLAISGLKTNIFSIGVKRSWLTATIVLAGAVVKFAAVLIPAMYGNIPFLEAFVLGLLMNARGINELIVYNLVYEDEKISGQDFTLLVISSVVVTAIISPIIKYIYDPSRRYTPLRRMTIQHQKKDGEMKLVVCVHKHDSVPTLINVD